MSGGLVCAGLLSLLLLGLAADAMAAVPGTFGKLTPANGATGRSTMPTATWQASTGATYYTVCADTTNDNTCDTSWVNVGNVTSVTWPGPELAHDTVYYWQVRAWNASGFTAADSQTWWSFRTQVDAPGAFTKTTPANGATGVSTSPTLTWGASTRATSYEYCYDTTNDGVCGGSWTSAGASTSAALGALSGGTTYYWQVRAVNAGGTSYADSSTWWSLTTQPGAFGKSLPANGATGRSLTPTVTWSASTGATSYEVCGDTTGNSACDTAWVSVGNVTSVTWPGPALAYDTLYFWQVRAVYGGSFTAADSGTWWNFRTQIEPPGAFTKSLPANGATGQSTSPTLTWGASARATSYEYCYDTTNDGTCSGTWTSTAAATGVGLGGLAYSTTYYWHVRAVNAGGTTYADANTWWSFTTQVEPPGAFGKAEPTNGAAVSTPNYTIRWAASARATGYEFCADRSNNGVCDGAWTPLGTTSLGVSVTDVSNGVPIYWQVRATNPGGTTYADAGAWWTYTEEVGPGAFGKSVPANGATAQATSLTLSWQPSALATSYEYCYDTTNDGVCGATWTSAAAATSAGLSGLAHATTYYWHVRAVNAFAATYADANTWWSFTTQVDKPAAFGKVTPANGATGRSTTPTAAWQASTGATSYEVCADLTNDSACDTSWVNVGNVTSVAWPGPELAHDTVYYWQVRAWNASGFTAADNQTWWSFRTQVEPPGAFGKSAPANGATGQSTSPTLTWGASARAASYEYCYDTTNDGACGGTWTSTAAATTVGLSGLSGGTTYYWHVRAVNAGGTTYADANTWWSFTTQVDKPAAFGKLTPANGATGASTLPTATWQASMGATYYTVCADLTNDNTCDTSWVNVGNVTSVAWPGPELAHDTVYYWQVRAWNASGFTAADDQTWWSLRTQAEPPGAFGKSAPANGATGQSTSPTLTWGASARAASYEYCYDTTNDGACGGTWTSTSEATTVGLSGLSGGTTYYWHVRAVNAGGTTYADANTWWSFTTQVPFSATKLVAGYHHTCALTPVGGVVCWGSNAYGQLGDGTTTDHTMPMPVTGLDSGVRALAAGGLHTCALTAGGGMLCWGSNGHGQLGDGTTSDHLTPSAVSGLASGVVSIGAGQYHSCAVTGVDVKCWGSNAVGQIGDGTYGTARPTPTAVYGLGSGIAAVAGGDNHTCVLSATGGVACWGVNGNGQLGIGTYSNWELTPQLVVGMGAPAAAITAGVNHTCALTTGGAVKCWGVAEFGAAATQQWTPTDVSGLETDVAVVSSRGVHTCALTTGGGVKCWGLNADGRIGDGTVEPRATPVDVIGLSTGVSALAAGFEQTCAATACGSVMCWGSSYGLTATPVAGFDCQQSAPYDFTGDGKSDLLWRHATGGDLWLWPMDGGAHTAESYVSMVGDPAWEIRGLGDQTGDEQADILWRHATTGQIYLWTMDGSTVEAMTYAGSVDLAFDIVGTGDYDGDGRSDILWRHQTTGELWLWRMDGPATLSVTYVDTVDLAYRIRGSGDLNGDGKADLVWQHATAGDVWVWLMNGPEATAVVNVGLVPDLDYHIVGVADYTGDGNADLLWHHATRGEMWLWAMNGVAKVSEAYVGTVPDLNYRIVGTGDYDGDGTADILWHHAAQGDVWVWLMDGTTKLSETWVGTVPDVGYQVVKAK